MQWGRSAAFGRPWGTCTIAWAATENLFRFHALNNMGYPFEGIVAHHGHKTTPYEDEVEFLKIMAWAKRQRRDLYPKRVRYATWNLYWHRAYWLSIERMIDPLFGATVDATVTGNTISVRAKNVGRLRFDLAGKLLDMAAPVRVEVNGREVYAGAAKAPLIVDVTPPPAGRFVKSPDSHGGITALVERSSYDSKNYLKVPTRPWAWAYGTSGSSEERAILKSMAPKWAKADTAISEAQRRKNNIFVYGSPLRNKLIASLLADLPVTFAPGAFTIAGKTYDKPEHCVKFVFPNPDNTQRHMIICACNDLKAAKARGFHGMTRESSWKFREGDCRVYGPTVGATLSKFGVSTGGGFSGDIYTFDAGWRAPQLEPIGEALEPFDYVSLLRLRADAMREAVDADVALVSGLEPGFSRWKSTLPAGPITTRSVTNTGMFPDYIMKCEVSGARLKGLLARSLVSSVLSSRQDPAYREGSSLALEDIQDDKDYTLATDYNTHGSISYSVNMKMMPKYFEFKSAEEFNAGEGSSFVVRNLVQTDVEVAAAVVSYIRKAGRVRPRAVDAGLMHYMLNPKANHFGACDWVHVALRKSAPGGGAAYVRRLTFNIGLRRPGDPESAPPRENAKTFLSFDADAQDQLGAEFNGMEKGLPVSVAVRRSVHAALVSAGGIWKLGDEPEGAPGEITGLAITITNRGAEPLTGLLLLGSPSVRSHYGGVWNGVKKGSNWYAGFGDEIGPRSEKYLANAAALVSETRFGAPKSLIMPGAGYGKGTIAGTMPLNLRAGETRQMYLVFASLGAAKGRTVSLKGLSVALEAVKGDLLNRLNPVNASLDE